MCGFLNNKYSMCGFPNNKFLCAKNGPTTNKNPNNKPKRPTTNFYVDKSQQQILYVQISNKKHSMWSKTAQNGQQQIKIPTTNIVCAKSQQQIFYVGKNGPKRPTTNQNGPQQISMCGFPNNKSTECIITTIPTASNSRQPAFNFSQPRR